MIDNIKNCKNCSLYRNQKPLLDNQYKADVVWVGLSAKKVDSLDKNIPLMNNTNTGKVIELIENNFSDLNFYKTNLVKCLPLLDNKLRYPNKNEIDSCIDNLFKEIDILKPKIVFLLGDIVAKNLLKYSDNNINFIKIYHPSYIFSYKKKEINNYVNNIVKIIKTNIC